MLSSLFGALLFTGFFTQAGRCERECQPDKGQGNERRGPQRKHRMAPRSDCLEYIASTWSALLRLAAELLIHTYLFNRSISAFLRSTY
jgi:hypothetical protein